MNVFKNLSGNKSSLETQPKKQGIDTYRELVKFHRQHYSSNLMALAILGKGKIVSKGKRLLFKVQVCKGKLASEYITVKDNYYRH